MWELERGLNSTEIFCLCSGEEGKDGSEAGRGGRGGAVAVQFEALGRCGKRHSLVLSMGRAQNSIALTVVFFVVVFRSGQDDCFCSEAQFCDLVDARYTLSELA